MLVVAVSRLWVIYYYDNLHFSILAKFSTLRFFKMFLNFPMHTPDGESTNWLNLHFLESNRWIWIKSFYSVHIL